MFFIRILCEYYKQLYVIRNIICELHIIVYNIHIFADKKTRFPDVDSKVFLIKQILIGYIKSESLKFL